MIKRYNMARSDNFLYSGKVTYVCSGSGSLNVVTGFPVTSAIVSFSTIPLSDSELLSSSSSSSSEEPVDNYNLPRIYVSGYSDNGFEVSYEGIPEDVGYIEFSFNAM